MTIDRIETPLSLRADDVTLGYTGDPVVEHLDFVVPQGEFTVIIGPNGCGKSTLLRGLGRTLDPQAGQVLLDDKPLRKYPAKEAARRIAMLPQTPVTPQALTVADLVARGRFPHQTLLRQWTVDDDRAVEQALTEVGMLDHAQRFVDELSGGQRQRVWIALTLAQGTPIVLLDEPTTFLDIAHQIDVLDLCSRLHRRGYTLVAVLHDLHLAARYATQVVAMRRGRIVAAGHPGEVITAELVREVYDLDAIVIPDPETGRPLVIPRDRREPST